MAHKKKPKRHKTRGRNARLTVKLVREVHSYNSSCRLMHRKIAETPFTERVIPRITTSLDVAVVDHLKPARRKTNAFTTYFQRPVWKTEIKKLIASRRADPNAIHGMPFPVEALR